MNRILILSLATVAVLPGLAQAGPRDPQNAARAEVQAGRELSVREIERRIVPAMKGMEYLGPAYDPAAMAYRLKFIHNGRVVFVDVDARSGAVIRQSR
ncbi:MAG: hypothetical protein JSS36_06775 [Proteobacteria bacterium]|nr:hypothetical protein [Pseudomonadota bacterium]